MNRYLGLLVGCLMLVPAVLPAAAARPRGTPAFSRAGFCRLNLSPNFRVDMGGYSDRLAKHTGVHDPIQVRAVVLAAGSQRVCIVGVDALLINRDLARAVKAAAAKATGIPEDAILICASHSHCAPYGYASDLSPDPKKVDQRLAAHYREGLTAAIVRANRCLQPAEVAYQVAQVTTMSHNRRSPNDPIDPALGVLVVRSPRGKVLGGVVNFTAHPVIMGEGNLELSGEWPGAAMTALERQVGGGSVFVFLQGCCGDVSIDRHGSSWSEVARVGGEMAALAAKLLPEAKCRPLRQVGAARLTTLVPAKPKADPVRFAAQEQELAAKLAQAQAAHAPADEVKALQRQLDTVKAEATVLPHFERLPRCAGTEIEIEASALRLNDTLVVGLGGEPFAQLGLDVKAGLPGFHTLVAAYCNDYVGYVPTRRGYQEGGYEAVTNRLAPGAGEAMAALGVRAGKACTGKPER